MSDGGDHGGGDSIGDYSIDLTPVTLDEDVPALYAPAPTDTALAVLADRALRVATSVNTYEYQARARMKPGITWRDADKPA